MIQTSILTLLPFGVKTKTKVDFSSIYFSKFIWALVFSSIFVLIFFYVFLTIAGFSGNFQIVDYEKKLSRALKENQGLKVKFGQVNSLAQTEIILKSGNFESIGKITYIEVFNNQVVKK